jgi:hypothetical protein
MNVADETRQVSEAALEQIGCLTEELIAARTDRDREHNFRLHFQGEALKYKQKYHLAVESLALERLRRE